MSVSMFSIKKYHHTPVKLARKQIDQNEVVKMCLQTVLTKTKNISFNGERL